MTFKNSAIVFPGQGSQRIGMLDSFLQDYPSITQQTVQESSDAIQINLLKLLKTGPVEKINQTEITQPLMLCADVTIWRVLQSIAPQQPVVVAGHSLGEYVALVASEVLNLSDATQIVHARGKAMQNAVPAGVGGVAAILGLDDAKVINICKEQHTDNNVVQAVNFNAPGQIVIAGHLAAVEKTIQQAKEKGAKRAIMLPLSVPVHCQLMQPAVFELQQAFDIAQWQHPKIPIIHNVNASLNGNLESIKKLLIKQLYNPVLWVKSIQNLPMVGTIVECGPGKVLYGLNRRISSEAKHFALNSSADLNYFIQST